MHLILRENELISAVTGLIKIYERLSCENKQNFNIFSILRNSDEEVMLHSRFIFELLNPTGTHSMNGAYLTAFVDTIRDFVKLPFIHNEAIDKSSVFREKYNIDLLILLSNGYTIIIENKIFASDQPKQLERYYNTIVKDFGRDPEKVIILYLTLDGHEPSAESIGDLKHEVHCINYANEILQWLDKCLNLSLDYKPLYEVIKQYKNLVKDLTDVGVKDSVVMTETANLILNSKESFKSANAIKNALPAAQTKVMQDVFAIFEKEMYNQSKLRAYNCLDDIRDYYTKRGQEVCPHQFYSLKSYSDGDFCFDFCLYIEIAHTLYYGFMFVERLDEGRLEAVAKEDIEKDNPAIYNECKNLLSTLMSFGKNTSDMSLYWNYFYDNTGNPYDFKQFSDNCIDLYMNLENEIKNMTSELSTIINNY